MREEVRGTEPKHINSCGIMNRKDNLTDVGKEGRIILKINLRKYGVIMYVCNRPIQSCSMKMKTYGAEPTHFSLRTQDKYHV
jgi:hypothetical protein